MPSPKPEPPKRKRGRPDGAGAFRPTGEQREAVKLMGALGIPEDRMVHAIVNPETRRPISPVTLRKHFREELDQGIVQADLKAGANLLKLTETSAAAAIFWAKCRLRWREREGPTVAVAVQANSSVATELEKRSMYDIGRRIAFVLSATASAIEAKPTPQKQAA